MKRITKSFLAIASVFLLGACSDDKDSSDGFDYSGASTVKFTSSIIEPAASRTVGNQWETADAIGMFAVEPGQSLSDNTLYDGKKNIKYATMGGATAQFKAALPSEAIQLKGKENIDVIAYYPYATSLNDFTLPIDVTNQSNPGKIDVLYSNNLRGIQASNEVYNLSFHHQLSKVILQVEPGNGYTNLDGLSAKDLTNVIVNGTMNIVNGEVSVAEGAKEKTIQPLVKKSGNNVLVEAILIPGQNLMSSQITLVLGNSTFTWKANNDISLDSGTKFTYRLQLSDDGSVVILNPEGDIEDWVEGNPDGGVEVITPDEDGENPGAGDVTTMADFRSKFAAAMQSPVNITEDILVKGVVTSSDESANIYKNLFIQDETAGIVLRMVEKDIYKKYPLGTELTINLKNFVVTQFNNSLQIKEKDNKEISFGTLDAAITNSKMGSLVTPKGISGSEIGAGVIHTLVQLDNVVFKDAGQAYFTGDANGVDRVVTTKDGKEIVVRVSKFATFNSQIIPSGEVTLVALVDVFKENYQLFMRDEKDVTAGGTVVEDKVSVDNTYMQFPAAGDAQNLNIIASSQELSWTIATSDAWITLDKSMGRGSGVVKVNAAKNSSTVERTGTIVLKSDKQQDVVITVFQTADNGGQPGQEITISLETFGENTGAKFDLPFGDVDAYTGFTSKAGIVVSNKRSRSDVRARTSVFNSEKLAWFPSYNPAYPYTEENPAPTFDFSNIETQGYTKLKVSYQLSGNTSKSDNVDINKMHVFIDGKEVPVPAGKTFTVGVWTDVEISVDAPFSQLTFKTDETNSVGIRLDNVKIVGTK